MIPYFSPFSFFDAFLLAFSSDFHKQQHLFRHPCFLSCPGCQALHCPAFWKPAIPLVSPKITASFLLQPRFLAACPRNDAIIFASSCYSHFNKKWCQFLRPNACLFRKCTLLYFLIPYFSPFYHSGLSALYLCVQPLITSFLNDTLRFAVFTLWYP